MGGVVGGVQATMSEGAAECRAERGFVLFERSGLKRHSLITLFASSQCCLRDGSSLASAVPQVRYFTPSSRLLLSRPSTALCSLLLVPRPPLAPLAPFFSFASSSSATLCLEPPTWGTLLTYTLG